VSSQISTRRRCTGFTLMEVMMVTLVVAITAVVVIPGSSSQDPVSIQAASANLSGDLEYAQAASVADPSDPVVVWFDAPGNRYWLAKSSTPTEPIDRPGAPAGTKFDVRLNEMAGNSRLDLTVEGVGSYVRFDAMGRLQQTSDIVVTLSNDSGRIDMFIDAESGSVSAMADASTSAVVTPGVFVDPTLVLRPEDEPPAQTPDQTAPAATASADPLQAAASRTVDTLIASGGTNATSSGTAVIGGVLVGITNTTRATTTAVAGTTTGTVAATTGAVTTTTAAVATTTSTAAPATTGATTAATGAVASTAGAVTATTGAVATTTSGTVTTTTTAVTTVTGSVLGTGASGSGSSGSGSSGSGSGGSSSSGSSGSGSSSGSGETKSGGLVGGLLGGGKK
jgi:prepilin-type N-terminal cleavage/methylation domain-containing protein